MAHNRISFLSVPIDVISINELTTEITEFTQKKEMSQICFVTIWDILKARINQEYMDCLKKAALVIPISKSILSGASFLKLPVPVRYNPFNAVITIMAELDKNYRSIYMFGSIKDSLLAAEKNVHSTFPGLHIVGRYVGYYPKSVEANIVEAIYKSSPSLVLMSDGIPGGNCWPCRKRKKFDSGIFLYFKDVLNIFSKRKNRVSASVFDKGLEIWVEIARNPLKLFLFFPFVWYIILLLWYKFIKKP